MDRMKVEIVDYKGGGTIETVGEFTATDALAYLSMVQADNGEYMDREGRIYNYYGHIVEAFCILSIQVRSLQ